MTVTDDATQLLAQKEQAPDEKLIVRGRYQIIPEGATKAVPHTRVTNFAKVLEDTYHLQNWGKRMVLLGAAHRTDLQAAALANSDDKQTLDRLAEQALDAAKANVSREQGTALHRMTERVDAGEDLDLPEPWRTDIAAYQRALTDHQLSVHMIEQVCIIPDIPLAGKFDRIVGDEEGRLYILDLKTGRSLDFSWGSIAIQLRLYANAATIYDPNTYTHTPMPPVSKEVAYVAHLPAGAGVCTLYTLDLTAAQEGIELVSKVKAWRLGTRRLATQVADIAKVEAAFGASTVVLGNETPASAELRAYAIARAKRIVAAEKGAELAAAWPSGVPTFKQRDDHLETEVDEILAACSAIEKRFELPFFDGADPRLPPPVPQTTRLREAAATRQPTKKTSQTTQTGKKGTEQ